MCKFAHVQSLEVKVQRLPLFFTFYSCESGSLSVSGAHPFGYTVCPGNPQASPLPSSTEITGTCHDDAQLIM